MNFNAIVFLFSLIYSKYIIVPVPYGQNPGATCRYYGYSDVIGSTQNISNLYNILNMSGYQDAYLAAYNGQFEGFVMSNTGAIQPFNKYTNPTNYSFCETSRYQDDGMPGMMKNKTGKYKTSSLNDLEENIYKAVKMRKPKKIFLSNENTLQDIGLPFNPNYNPEVYYDDRRNYRVGFPKAFVSSRREQSQK
jgi:hypothetical protein